MCQIITIISFFLFIVKFQELPVEHVKTVRRSNDVVTQVANLDLFDEWDFALNWDEDRFEVSFAYNADDVDVKSAKFFFQHRPAEDRVDLRTISEKIAADDRFTAEVSTFDKTIRVFSPYNRQFEVDLEFVYDDEEFVATFKAKLPRLSMR